MTITSQFFEMTSPSIFFDVVVFLFSSLVTGPSLMSSLLLILELLQFSFIRDWPEILKSEITPSEFCPVSNLTRMSLMKCYWNARVTALAVSGLLRENQQRGKITPLSPTQIRFNNEKSHQVYLYYRFANQNNCICSNQRKIGLWNYEK